MTTISVGGRQIGPGRRCFVIAEAGVNHNGDAELARRLVDAAAEAKADAVKFQSFEAARMVSRTAPKAEYQRATGESESQREMLEKLQLSRALHEELKTRAESRGLLFLSSPFDEPSADLLAELGVAAFKLASGEVTNHPFLRYVAKKGQPLLVSTGMCTLDEVRGAVDVIRGAANRQLALFHCVSAYPAAAADCNLRAMATLQDAFQVPVGWSDHTDGIEISVAAVALGAQLIEKHLTIDRSLPGPDHRASLEPEMFRALVAAIRATESSLGDGVKVPRPVELPIAAVARKSLHFARAMSPGTRLTGNDLVALRPGTGIGPDRLQEFVGASLRRAVESGAPLTEQDVE